MKRIIALLGMVIAFFATGMLLGTPAWATDNHEGYQTPMYKTVVWEMPSWDIVNNLPRPTWPQAYFASSDASEVKDFVETALPECGQVQIDVYRYTTKWDKKHVDALIGGGVLTAPNKPFPEPVVKAKLVNLGACSTPSPTPTPTPSVTPSPTPTPSTTPTPTPSASTPKPTPSSTPSASSPTCTHEDGLTEGCLPGTGGGDIVAGIVVGLMLVLGGAGLYTLTKKRV